MRKTVAVGVIKSVLRQAKDSRGNITTSRHGGASVREDTPAPAAAAAEEE